jgi:UDP-glucuronate decarboxylase
MRILVTGGAGFVGSNLVARLLGQGHSVIALDNFMTGRRENLSAHFENPEFVLVDHDVTNPLPARMGKVDRVYHLACPASPPQYQRDPIYTARIGFLGTLHALEYAHAHGARLLLASTSEIYGDPEVHPQREDYRGAVSTTGPRACYDEGKRIGETLAADFERTRGTGIRIARIFNTYGPNMDPDDGRVVSNFLVQALRGAPLTIYGSGEQTRSFCYVDDLLDGLTGLMECASNPGPVNLGNPVEFTIAELATAVEKLLGKPLPRDVRPLPTDDPTRRKPDISKAAALLAFAPRTPLEAGLVPTLEYFRQRIANG